MTPDMVSTTNVPDKEKVVVKTDNNALDISIIVELKTNMRTQLRT